MCRILKRNRTTRKVQRRNKNDILLKSKWKLIIFGNHLINQTFESWKWTWRLVLKKSLLHDRSFGKQFHQNIIKKWNIIWPYHIGKLTWERSEQTCCLSLTLAFLCFANTFFTYMHENSGNTNENNKVIITILFWLLLDYSSYRHHDGWKQSCEISRCGCNSKSR